MDWRPDRSAKKAIYKQLAEYMEQGIADGTFPPDKPLPSERYLAKELNVNRSTVVAAYDELEANGLIQRNRGSGTTISKDIWGIAKNVFRAGTGISKRALFAEFTCYATNQKRSGRTSAH